MPKSHLSLSQVISIVDKGFKQLFGDFEFWFDSEISRLKIVNNHIYLDLMECEDDGKTLAKARGNIFDRKIWSKFMNEVKLKDIDELKGYKLLFRGTVSFHSDYGFAIKILEVSSQYVIGQLKKNQDEIKSKLVELGIYEKNKKVPLPVPPYNIAVISSESSEGLKDFSTILSNSGFNISLQLYPCAVHGNEAKVGVYKSLQTIYTDIKSGKKIDFVAIIRGGGGSHGISWQDDINIAKGVAYMPVPVIVAVGHTADKYILDEISKFSAQTPTQAAHIVIDILNNYLYSCEEVYKKILESSQNKLKYIFLNLDFLLTQISSGFRSKISFIFNNLENIYRNISMVSPSQLVKYGYCVLRDREGRFLNKNEIENLKSGDSIYIQVYNKSLLVEIKEVEGNQ